MISVFTGGATGNITATFNGVALTQLSYVTDNSSSNHNSLLYLVNPASGSNTISVSRVGGSSSVEVTAVAYSGVDDLNPIDDSATSPGVNSSTFNGPSVTVGSADNWLIATFRNTDNRTITSALMTQRAFGGTVRQEHWDSDGTVAAGSQAPSYSLSSSGRFDGYTLASINAAPTGGGSSNIKSIAGVARANIKSIAGVVLD